VDSNKEKGKMKRWLFCAVYIVCFQFLSLSSAFAFQMADYWPITAGNLLIFDNEIMTFSSSMQKFGQYNARKTILGATFCEDLCGNHLYLYLGPEGLLAVALYNDGGTIDVSATPVKLFSAEMQIGDSVVSTVPAGVIDSDQITFTATLSGKETVAVPAGTFKDTLVLVLLVEDSPSSHYTEKLWLAKGVGPVKIERVDESPVDNEGCLFTCGCFNRDTEHIVQREIKLEDFFSQKKGVVVVPLF